MTPEEREAWLDHLAETDEPPGEEDWEDFAPLTAEEIAQTREGAAAGPAIWAAMAGRRGPGQPGSARTYPGESASTAAAFWVRDDIGCHACLHRPGAVRRHSGRGR